VTEDVRTGPVMMYGSRRDDVARFYADLVGMPADPGDGSTWLKTANADVVIHGPDEREAPPEVRAQSGFVVWFGVADMRAAYERARRSGALVGESYGDYFFARDPDGRFIGIYPAEGHGHDHEH
jgi:hypothetical protein